MSSLRGGRDRLELLGEGRGGDQEEGVRSLDREMEEREGEGELLRFFLSFPTLFFLSAVRWEYGQHLL